MLYHNTDAEIAFIKGLGSHAEILEGLVTREKLLRGYLEGCEQRHCWRGMDRGRILRFARKELEREGR